MRQRARSSTATTPRSGFCTSHAIATALLANTGLAVLANHALAEGRKIDPALVSRPSGTQLVPLSDQAAALKVGERLFDSLKLSENGLTCKSCHFKFEAYETTFLEPYPHSVKMAKTRAGLKSVSADEMVQLCLVITMDSSPLDWQSEDLAALTAYVLQQQIDFNANSKD